MALPADYQQILDEEFEVSGFYEYSHGIGIASSSQGVWADLITCKVLDSIFPDELEKLSERSLRIQVEPDDASSSHPLTLHLYFTYPPTYPDVLPDMEFEPIDEDSGELHEEESEAVLGQLRMIGEESLGIAMTFTIASAAREALGEVVKGRLRKEKEDDDRRTREYEEAEATRTRGTPLTGDSFDTWRKGFVAELKGRRDQEEDERIRALPPKEREEYRRRRERLSGKQLFETSQTLATSDEALYEEGTGEGDLRQYTREERERERRRAEEYEEKRRRCLVDAGGDSDGE